MKINIKSCFDCPFFIVTHPIDTNFTYDCKMQFFNTTKKTPEQIPNNCKLLTENIIITTNNNENTLEELLQDAFEAGSEYERTSIPCTIGEFIGKDGDVDFYQWQENNKIKINNLK